ncbi:hypothetical protein SAMN02745746_01458 [Pseudogulbenkiania subflava DSM 22618]|uniref:DUF2345 domain-containing protein n=1 Tax=Pseudogulbenkiania subflava DSM 22618 TaxID=1123014 RepID=A0A1Y6BNM2_9NEIS|nr:hypothetical protein SAMN02745746_01458 [Pseudogulbenkiania subflava DSM 22618]
MPRPAWPPAPDNALTLAAGSNIDQVAQRDTNQTSGRRWLHNVGQHISLFVAGVKDKVSLKLIAAKGMVQVQAQSDAMELTADKDVAITSCKGKVVISAKQDILLTSGGGYIKLSGGNIDIHCPSTVSIKGADHALSGPASLDLPLPVMPPNEPCRGSFKIWRTPERLLKNRRYWLVADNGSEISSKLGDDGQTGILGTPEMAQMTLHIAELPDNQRISGDFRQKLSKAQAVTQLLDWPSQQLAGRYQTPMFDCDLQPPTSPTNLED